MTLPTLRTPYSSLSLTVQDELNASSDNLELGTDFSNYSSSALRMGQIMTQMIHKHIQTYEYQRWHNDTEPSTSQDTEPGGTASAMNGNGTTTTTTTAAATNAPSKLEKMWKRIKRVFGGGGRQQRQERASNPGKEGNNDIAAVNDTSGNKIQGNSSKSPPTAALRRVKSGRTLPKVDLPYSYCARYTNPGYIMKHNCTNQPPNGEQTFSSIINSNLEELDGKVKVEAWVAHLGEFTASGMTKDLIASASSSSSSAKN